MGINLRYLTDPRAAAGMGDALCIDPEAARKELWRDKAARL
jgi:hypothetical protein